MISVKFDQVLLSNMGFVILLKEEGDGRTLPIFIGTVEARAIIFHVQNIEVPRPLTHDLLKNILEYLDCEVKRVEVCDLKEGTFYAKLVLDQSGVEIPMDSRPSDAIAIALRFNAPIFVAEEVMDEAGHASLEIEAAGAAKPQGEEKEEGKGQESKLGKLKGELEKAVSEERYEDAAKLRDEVKRLEEKHNDN